MILTNAMNGWADAQVIFGCPVYVSIGHISLSLGFGDIYFWKYENWSIAECVAWSFPFNNKWHINIPNVTLQPSPCVYAHRLGRKDELIESCEEKVSWSCNGVLIHISTV